MKQFINLNVNMDMIMKNVKHLDLNTKTACHCCLEYTNAKDHLTK